MAAWGVGKRAGLAALTMGVLCVCLVGCATHRILKTALRAERAGEYDKAVLIYARLFAQHPENERWKIGLTRTKFAASQAHFQKAKRYLVNERLELAIGELQQVVILDPSNSYAQTELETALKEWQEKRAQADQTEMERLKEKVAKSTGAPLLDPRSNIPVILQFRDAEIGKIYDVLSKATGINFLYDPQLKLDKKITIELTNVPFEKAMDTLMLTNKHFFKVLDENTILIAEDNQQKRREYADEVIQTFYLSNADVKDVQSLLRTMLDARKVVQNTQLNAITIRDTPNKVAIARKLIEANDKAKAELIVDVELMEVNRTVSKTVGIGITPRQYAIQFTGPDRVPLNNLGLLNQIGLYSLGPIPQVTIDFLKSDSGTRVLAKPQLRVTEGETANLHIGDSVPIPTTTFNTTTSVGGGVLPITSFTYQEVGIVIEIEPRVHHNKEVTLKLNVEVSALGDTINAGQGISQPTINTRQINTVIRLKDGESSLLAGLINNNSTAGKTGFPGLMDTPVLGKIFSSSTSTRRETDLILTLTPRIIRIPDIREEDLQAMWIGNEANPRLRGAAGSVFATPFTAYAEEPEKLDGEPEADGQQPAPGDAQPASTTTVQPPPAPAATPPGTSPGATPPIEEPVTPTQPPAQPPAETPAEPAAMNLTIAPARLTVAGGGRFSVNLLVNNVVDLQKIRFSLSYDPSTIAFDSGLEGILMKSDGSQTFFSAEKTGAGMATIEIDRIGAEAGISRGGALAALRFIAGALGRTTITFATVVAESSQGKPITVHTVPAEITVAK